MSPPSKYSMELISRYETNKHDISKPLTIPGDARILEVTINGKDLTNKTMSIVMFENLSLPIITGELLIIDTLNIASTLPIIGGEEIMFIIEDCYRVRRTFNFRATKVSDRSPASTGSLIYRLHFSSETAVLSSLRKISKSYSKKKTEEIANDVLVTYLNTPKFRYSPTASQISCIIPNWRPVHALRWLASRSVSGRSEFANSPYIVFAELDGYVNMLPLDFLYDSTTNIERGTLSIKYNRPFENGSEAVIQYGDRMGTHQLSFEQFEIVKTTDFIENLQMGMYYTGVTEIDLLARDTKQYEYKYADDFGGSRHLNPFPFLREHQYATDELSHWRTRPSHDGLFSDEPYTARIDEYSHHHVSKWQQTEQMVIRGVLPGSFELRVGQKYRVEIPAWRNASTENIGRIDERMSGNYIVEAIKHEFTPNNRYVATCQLFTDSISKKVESL